MTQHVHRRKFLAALAGGVGGALHAPTVARAGSVSTARRPSAADRVGIGHIGVGGMGRGHLGAYAQDASYPTVAVCDVDRRQLDAAAARAGAACGRHVDYRELLDRRDVDAVIIAVPDHWHALCAVHACEAGKDVYCEKPLSLTVGEGRAMVDAARASARVFQTGSQQRSSPEFRRACELVRSGRLGALQSIWVRVWGSSRPCHLPAQATPEGLDWERWLGPAPWRPFHARLHPFRWRSFREYSGGAMTDWGAHHLDIAQWGLGMDEGGPVEVLPPSPGNSWVTIRYASGIAVRCGNVGVNGVQFVGASGKVTVNRGFFRAEPEELAREPLRASDVRLYRSAGHHADWRRSLWTRRRPVCDVEIGHRSATVCHLANIAIWSGRRVRWDPAREQILDDRQLQRWLSRPMRAPWAL